MHCYVLHPRVSTRAAGNLALSGPHTPISHHDRKFGLVPVRGSGSVYSLSITGQLSCYTDVHWNGFTHQRARCSVGILHRIVTVVPRTPILSSLPSVGKVVARCDGTLCDSRYSVHVSGVQLTDAMPVYSGSVERQIIDEIDMDSLFNTLANSQG